MIPRIFSDMSARKLLLPATKTREDYEPIYRDADVWLPAMRTICERHSLDKTLLELAPPGTHVVFRVGPHLYIKLFALPWSGDLVPERLVLRKLSGRTDLPIPRLVTEGEIEGWPYIIITAVDGIPLCKTWNSMETSDREHIAARCGELMSTLHATPTEGLEAIAVDWPTFVDSQIQDCRDQLIQTSIDRHWIYSVVEFTNALPPLVEPDFRPVLLSADVTDEHILVSERGGRWELTGFIDFGDAMLGHPYYDFVAPGALITRSSPSLQRAMLLAYGYSSNQLNANLANQLMAYTLIHRFFNISELLEQSGTQPPACFEDLKRELWSFA